MRTQRRTWSIKIRISLLTHRRRASRRFPDRRDTCFASLSCCAIVHSSLQLPPLSHFHDHDDLSSFVKIRAPSLSFSFSVSLSLFRARAAPRKSGGREEDAKPIPGQRRNNFHKWFVVDRPIFLDKLPSPLPAAEGIDPGRKSNSY